MATGPFSLIPVEGLLEDLVDRGLDLQRGYLVGIDGSKALRSGVERVFGDRVEVQRCQIHKRRNVKEYLPENCQKDYDRRMRNAYAMRSYTEAKAALEKIFQLEHLSSCPRLMLLYYSVCLTLPVKSSELFSFRWFEMVL